MKSRIIGLAFLAIVTVGGVFTLNQRANNAPDVKLIKADQPDSSGSTAQAQVTYDEGKVINIVFDSIATDGVSKRKLSVDGEYIMTEDGAKWHEQMDDVAEYMVKNQSADGLNLNEEGKTDVISSASISISEYVLLGDKILNVN